MNTEPPLYLPQAFKTQIINTFGQEGQTWLVTLPALIDQCRQQFKLKIQPCLPNLSFNYIAPTITADGMACIIKICPPNSGVDREIAALQYMQGDGIVKLLKSNQQQALLLLEKLTPGQPLARLKEDSQATTIAAELMQKLWRKVPEQHNFSTTEHWFARLGHPVNLPADFSTSLLAQAKSQAQQLHQDMTKTMLLHGDLHHFNILSSQRQPWLAIDPKGVLGEPAYEVGALLRNPIPDIATTMNTKKVLARRIDQLSDILNFDRHKIIAWGLAQAVLAAVWAIDDQSQHANVFLKCAQVLATMK